MSTFVLVTHGSDGDVAPFVQLGADLVRLGHRATLLTHAPYRSAAVDRGVDFVAIDDEADFERALAATPRLLASGRPQVSWTDFYRQLGLFEQVRSECDELLRLHVRDDTVFVGRHTSSVSVRFVAEATGAPVAWVALSPIQLMAVPIAAHTYGTELASEFDAIRATLGLAPIRDWARWFTTADAEIALWPHWFDAAGHRSPRRVRLTDFPLSAGYPQQIPVDAVRPILATGGTGRMLHHAFYPALIDALAYTDSPAALVVRHRDLLPRHLPANVTWYPRLPFAQVMPAASVVVHHGGIGTCVQALAAGTPQVLMADGIDRPDNASRLAALGLARSVPVERWAGDTIAAEIVAAMDDADYAKRAVGIVGGAITSGTEVVAEQLVELAGRRASERASRLVAALSPEDRQRLRQRLERRLTPPLSG